MAARRGGDRYPRPGERLAPATLQEVLLEPAPARLVDGTPAAGLRLCDLDESIWEKLEPDAILALAEITLDRVAAGCARQVFHKRRFPRPPEGLKFEDLRLEHRTRLCLTREGFDEDPGALGRWTIGEILSIRSFGPRCLVDLLSALETLSRPWRATLRRTDRRSPASGRDARSGRGVLRRSAFRPRDARGERRGPIREAVGGASSLRRRTDRTHDSPRPRFAGCASGSRACRTGNSRRS